MHQWKKIDIPSYGIQVDDVISLSEKYRTNEMFASNFLELKSFTLPYIEKDFDHFGGRLIRLPHREEIPIEVNEILVIELYSK